MNVEQLQQEVMWLLSQHLSEELYYHSPRHTQHVVDAVERIAHYEQVSTSEVKILKTAALLHDIGFICSYENHEEYSCSIARDLLPKYGLDKAEVEQVIVLILSTKVPQSPKDKLAQILCDADLDYLGTDQFFKIGNLLFEEFKLRGVVTSRKEWNLLQVKFLKSHHYFTRYSELHRVDKKMENLKKVEELVAQESEL